MNTDEVQGKLNSVTHQFYSVDLQRFPVVNLIPTNPSDKWWILPEETWASLMLLWAFPPSWTKLCELLLTLSYPVQTLCLHHTSDLCQLKLDRLLFSFYLWVDRCLFIIRQSSCWDLSCYWLSVQLKKLRRISVINNSSGYVNTSTFHINKPDKHITWPLTYTEHVCVGVQRRE